MKRILFGAALSLCTTAWAGQAEDWLQRASVEAEACVVPKAESWAQRRAELEARLPAFMVLAEETLALRAAAISFYHSVLAQRDAGQPLSGRDIERLNEGMSALLAKRATLLKAALAYECWTQLPIPSDAQAAQTQAAGISLALSSALLLYDNYLSAVSLYRDQLILRQHLNQADSKQGRQAGELNRSAAMFASAENRLRVRRAIRWYEKNARNDVASSMEGATYLRGLIDQSPAYSMIRSPEPLHYMGRRIGLFKTIALDKLSGAKREGVNLTSLLFGNTVGLIETRQGKLYNDAAIEQQVLSGLRAGDILLEKTPFRLTDKLIPGHWGHAALWVGSEEELRALGIWEHPYVQPYQQKIRNGQGVIEALRSGVVLNTARRFLNIDDLAVLRQQARSDSERAKVILQAMSHLGKSYDFNFDTEDTRRIFCSELVYLAYGDVSWPTSRVMGRYTISPNDVAQRATQNGPLQVELLFHDGKSIPRDEQSARFTALLTASSK